MIQILFRFLPIDRNLIVLDHVGFSGSNLSFLLEQNRLTDKFKIVDINQEFKNNAHFSNTFVKLKSILIRFFYLNRAKLIMRSHGSNKLLSKKSNQIVIETWHGFPLKSLGNMVNNNHSKLKGFNSDYIITLSKLQNTFLCASYGETNDKFRILGYPRNDYLFNEDGKLNLSFFINGINDFDKIVFAMPTWRTLSQNLVFDDYLSHLFGFEFDIFKLDEYFFSINFLLIIKLHPVDELKFQENLLNLEFKFKSVFFLTDIGLAKNSIDLYKLLNSADLLITDYSSVYFDFMLLDRPILFVPGDLVHFSQDPGFLVESYDFWTPGDKVHNINEFKIKILEALSNDKFSQIRNQLKNEVHRYKDNNSSNRLISFIESIMQS